MNSEQLWNCEETVKSFGIEVPAWINQDILAKNAMAIQYGGCASGAYMPAVTYHRALKTLNDHEDDLVQYIHDSGMEVPQWNPQKQILAGFACDLVSLAVEIFAFQVIEQLEEDYE